MFFGFDLKELFLFPVKDAESRRYFFIGTAISLSAFIIPIIPFILLTGYAIQIVRQIFNDETPRLVAWNNWGDMFKDGLKIFGVRMAYSLPILILVIPMILVSIIMPLYLGNSNSSQADPIFFAFMAVFTATMCILVPISIPLAVIIPAAEMHAVAKNEFSAGFQIRAWWAVLRSNLGGFIAAFGIYYLTAICLTLIIQILMATIVLSCLLPILLPAVTFYIILIMYAAIAQAYKDGAAKLELTSS